MKILVGATDTEQGNDALALGTRLAQAYAAELVLATAPAEEGETVAELARAHAADLVVLGSTHRGPVGRIVPGATVERLLGNPPCAVAVAPPGFARAPRTPGWRPLSGDAADPGMRVIGVGYDGSGAAGEALKAAVDLALANGAALRVYTVARRLPHVPTATSGGRTNPRRPRTCARPFIRRSPASPRRRGPCRSSFVASQPTSSLARCRPGSTC